MKYKINDQIPNCEVFQLIDGNPKKFQINNFFKDNKSILLGMPGAFTSVCSNKHLPSYKDNIDKIRSKGVDKVFCISVNDPYVMDAWGQAHNIENKITMLSDPYLSFTKAIGAEVDRNSRGMGIRSNRYSMVIENLEVTNIQVEKETKECGLSAAESILDIL